MRTTRPFAQVDVFTALPYLGNPLAVVLDGAGLSDAGMQAFARWTNLSETTFLLPPSPEGLAQGADYRVRIFTPGGELPFAGHPTLGSCHAWLEAGGTPRATDTITQECQVGLIRIQRDGARLAFGAPSLKRSNPSPKLLAQVAAALGLKPAHIIAAQHLDNGPQWLGLLLDSPHTVLQVQPDHAALKDLGQKVGVAGVEPAPAAPTLIARGNREARAFGARSANAEPANTASDSRTHHPGSARLCRATGHQRRPGHRQPECQSGPVANCRWLCPQRLHCRPRHLHRPRRPRAHSPGRRRPGLGRWPFGDLHPRQRDAMSALPTHAEIEAAAQVVYREFAATPQYAWGLLE